MSPRRTGFARSTEDGGSAGELERRPGAFTSRDWLCLAILVLAALALRSIRLGEVGLSHYDEGAYGMSALAVARDDPSLLYPQQPLLSPPLLYTLQGLLMRVLGEGDGVIIGLAVTLGTFGVGAIFLLGREWHGMAAGVAAGTLACLADFHIVFSRVGLTDILFLLTLCAALWAYTVAERRKLLGYSLLAGLLTGLAWNTKYHGWLAGVVAGAALLPRWIPGLAPRDEPAGARSFWRGFVRILVAATVATALYAHWFLYVQGQPGGYPELLEYQSAYLQPQNAVRNVILHVRMQQYIGGLSGQLALPIALLAAAAVTGRFRLALVVWAVALFGLSRGLGLSVATVLIAAIGAFALIRRRDHAAYVALAFVTVFACLSPLYRPYARLLLPLMAASYLLAGVALDALVERRLPRWLERHELPVAGFFALVLSVLALTATPADRGSTYRPSAGLREATAAIASKLPPEREVIVVGEPAVVFYLRTLGFHALHSNGPHDFHELAVPGRTYSLVVGRYSGSKIAQFGEDRPGALSLLGSAAVDSISDVRLLDDFDPSWAATWSPDSENPRYDVTAYAFDHEPEEGAVSPPEGR